jgi:hypothetical protein
VIQLLVEHPDVDINARSDVSSKIIFVSASPNGYKPFAKSIEWSELLE